MKIKRRKKNKGDKNSKNNNNSKHHQNEKVNGKRLSVYDTQATSYTETGI